MAELEDEPDHESTKEPLSRSARKSRGDKRNRKEKLKPLTKVPKNAVALLHVSYVCLFFVVFVKGYHSPVAT